MLKNAKQPSPAAPSTRGEKPAREPPAAGVLAFPVSTRAGGGPQGAAAPPPPPTPRPVLRRKRASADEAGACPQCASARAAERATGVRARLCPTCEAERTAQEAGIQRLRADAATPSAGPTDGGGPPASPASPPPPPSGGDAGLVPAGGGRALDAGTRAFFEARLGRDLGAVRVHSGAQADASARSVNALAFTLGRDVVFRGDRFSPGTGEGRRLLAHELTHVAQQGFAPEPPAAAPASSAETSPASASRASASPASVSPSTASPSLVSPSPASPDTRGAVQRAAEGDRSEAADEAQARAVAARVADGGDAGEMLAGTAVRAPAVRRDPPPGGDPAPAVPEPMPVTFGLDTFEATVGREERSGSPYLVIRLRYTGGHAHDLRDGVLELSTMVAPRPFAARRIEGVQNELALDLYGDRAFIVRVEDSIEYDAGPPRGRRHAVTLRMAGRWRMSAMTFTIQDPGARPTDARAFRPPDLAGARAGRREEFGEPVLAFDGDGDGFQELEARPQFRPRLTPDLQALYGGGENGHLVLYMRQRADPTNAERGLIFRYPPADDSVRVNPRVERQTDGAQATRIALTEPVGGRTVDVHPGVRADGGVSYVVEGGGARGTIRFPTDPEPARRLYTAGDVRVAGKNAFWDVDIGPYGDRFRITVDRGDEARPVIGVAPLFRGVPSGGRGAVLSYSGPLAGVRLLRDDPVTLGVDLDGDGRPDVRVNDRMEQPADVENGTPEGDRDHRFTLTGPALPGGLTFTVQYREGHLWSRLNPAGDADHVAAAALQATAALSAAPETSAARQAAAYTDAFGAYRLRAVERGWITRALFDAWYALSADAVALELQVPTGTVDGALRARAVEHARALWTALEAETSPFAERSAGYSNNPYTGEITAAARGVAFHQEPPGRGLYVDLMFSRWADARTKLNAVTRGLDRFIGDRAAAAGERDVEQMRGVAAMGAALRELPPGAIRVPAVFVPSAKFSREPGYADRIPLELYHWRDGSTWRLVDLTNPARPFRDAVDERATPAASANALMSELNNTDHFPEGRVYWDWPGMLTGQVPVQDRLTWRDFFTWLGIGLAVVGVTLVTAGSGTVAVAGMWMLAGSAVAGATSATLDLIEGARHGTLTAGRVVLNLAQIVGAIAGVGAMAAGRILSVARASAAASAPLTGARWAQAATLAQRAVIPLAATNVAADTVQLAVLTAQGIEQLDAIDRSGASEEEKRNARLRIMGQLALTGGLTALSLRGNVAEITMGRSIEVVNVAGEPVVVPVGTSFAGRAIERSAADLAAAPAASRTAAEASHLDAIRRAVGGVGGESLARVEGMAMARAAGTGGAVVVDAAGAVTSATGPRSVRELAEEVARANNAARAHGTATEYVLEMRPGAAAGTTEAFVVARPRASVPAAGATAHLYVDVGRRAADEAAQITRVQAAAARVAAAAGPGTLPRFRAQVLPDGLISVNGAVDVHPARLAEISDTDLASLVRATKALEDAGFRFAALEARDAASAAIIRRFSSSDPDVDPTRTPQRGYRLRFPHNRAEALANLDGLLAKLGKKRSDFPAFANAERSLTDQERLYDLVTASVPGGTTHLRTQATRYALDQAPADVRTFVEHYEFYMAEFTNRMQARTRAALAGTTRTKLSDSVKKRLHGEVERELSGEPGTPAAAAALVAPPAQNAAIRATYDRMAGQLNGRFGNGAIATRLSDVDAVRAVQGMADVQFGSQSAAVYHAHKHFAELPLAHQALRAEPILAYLDSAVHTIRNADPVATAARRNTSQYGTGRSFAFVHEGRRAIVVVTNEGRVILATYP